MTETNNGDIGHCGYCGLEAQSYCSACSVTRYCSIDHQKKHWKQHKLDCQPYKIVQTEHMGRVLIATRDIPAKTKIFVQNPLCVGPKWYISERDETVPIVPCVGCYSPCQIGNNSCPRCKWPSCSPMCQGLTNSRLHGLECPILALGPGPSDHSLKALLDYYRTDSLFVLKCLLLQWKQPKKWEELLTLQSHETERLGSELYIDAENRIVSFLEKNFLTRFKKIQEQQQTQILMQYDTKMLHKICGIIETNYMCINVLNGLELSGLFPIAAFMEHNCQPNCYFLFDHQNGFKISVIAGSDIKKDEHLTISYSNMLWGTQLRNEHLCLTKHFDCECQRCRDPTELGTYFSALKCIGDDGKKCNGIILPVSPLSKTTNWKCNICPVEIGSDEVNYFTSQMGEEVDNLLSSKPTIKQLENLIEKLSNFLHPNHHHLFNMKHSLIQLYGTQPGYLIDNLSDDMLYKKMYMCCELLNICDKLDPSTIRLSIYVGVILHEMNTVLVEHGKRILNGRTSVLESSLTALQSTVNKIITREQNGNNEEQTKPNMNGCLSLLDTTYNLHEENNVKTSQSTPTTLGESKSGTENGTIDSMVSEFAEHKITNGSENTAVNTNTTNCNGKIEMTTETTAAAITSNTKQAVDNFKLARDYLLRAAEVLKKELDNVGGAKLSDVVIKGISMVDNLMSNNS